MIQQLRPRGIAFVNGRAAKSPFVDGLYVSVGQTDSSSS